MPDYLFETLIFFTLVFNVNLCFIQCFVLYFCWLRECYNVAVSFGVSHLIVFDE